MNQPKDITQCSVSFIQLERSDIKNRQLNTRSGWAFNWLKPYSQGFEIHAMVMEERPTIIQGLIALRGNDDPDFICVDVDLIESAPQNKKIINGKTNPNRQFMNCGRLLVAYACLYSFRNGYDGFVELTSKSSKMPFYESLGAIQTYGQNFLFSTDSANRLVTKYF